MLVQHIGLLVGVGELQSPDVVFIEAVALQSVNHQRRLEAVLEVSEAKDDLLLRADLPRDEPHRFKSSEGSKDIYRQRQAIS